jgi:Cu+-exporting ATPase
MSGKTDNNTQNTTSSTEPTACIHCGDPCGSDRTEDDGLQFCCAGCRTVYSLLHDHGLETYYSLEDKPGVKPGDLSELDRYAYLDKDDIRYRLLDFDDGRTGRVTFSVPQIHCSSCIWLLENLYRLHEGVLSSRVDFQRRKVSISFGFEQMPLGRLVALMASLGYEPEIRLSDLDSRAPDRSFRALYGRLAVAGFCFGNVMLLSFPRYLGLEGMAAESYLFDYLKLVLSLPVVFYGAWDFFKPAFLGLRSKQINMDVPISLGIVILFARSAYEIVWLGEAGYLDSLCALVFLLLIGRLYQKKTYSSLTFDRDYRSYLPIAVRRVDKDGDKSVPLDDIEIGDRLLIRNQELIPADAVLRFGEAHIDYSFVTGESATVPVKAGDRMFAGGRQAGATIEVEVLKSPSRSYLLQLWEQTETAVKRQPGVTTLATRMSQWFTPAILLLALAAGVVWAWIDSSQVWTVVTAVLIVACPCALALSSPFALGTAQRLIGKAGYFLRDSSVVESLARVTSVVFDKTGTITQSGSVRPVWNGRELTDRHLAAIHTLVRQSTHPLSVRLVEHLQNHQPLELENFIEETGRGLEAVITGQKVRVGSARWTGATTESGEETNTVYVSFDGEVVGHYDFASPFRPGLRGVIARLRERFSLSLLSGDTDKDKGRAMDLFGAEADLRFHQSPYEKLDYVDRMIRDGERVVMIGDGLNDAGALRAATVGLTVVEDESGFTPASDGVISASDFDRLPRVISLAADTIGVIKASFAISILYNIVGLGFALSGQLSPVVAAILMPASSVTVVLFTTLTTGFLARRRKVI